MSIDLEAIKARAEAATPGPWIAETVGEFGDKRWQIDGVLRSRWGVNVLSCDHDEATTWFIAHAREDVPTLVVEVERLRAVIEDVRKWNRVAGSVFRPELERVIGSADSRSSDTGCGDGRG